MTKNHFHSARLKAERAKRHIDEITVCLAQDATDDGAYGVVAKPNPNGGGDVLQLEVRRPLRNAYALCLGDAVHNLRTALDFVASDLVRTNGHDAGRVHFPMHETRENLVDALQKREIKKAGADVCNFILDEIKPYKAGNFPLWALNKLDNLDKHSLIVPVMSFAGVSGVDAIDDRENRIVGCSFVAAGPGQFGMIQLPGKIKITNYGKPTLTVLFGKGQFFEDQAIVPTLHQLRELVAGILDSLETFRFGKG